MVPGRYQRVHENRVDIFLKILKQCDSCTIICVLWLFLRQDTDLVRKSLRKQRSPPQNTVERYFTTSGSNSQE